MRIFIQTICLLLVLTVSAVSANGDHFEDVAPDNLYYRPIEYFASLGVVQGYKNTTTGGYIFKPEQTVNRAEAIKIILAGSIKQYSFASSLSQNVFPDVKSSDWFAPYVKTAKDEGIVKGNDKSGLFDPARTVNKAELLKMIFIANSIDTAAIQNEVPGSVSADVSKTAWFYPYMLYGKEFGIIFPDPLGNFNPGKELTRGEVMDIMYNTAKILKGGSTQQLLSRTEAKIFAAITKINLQLYAEAVEVMKQGVEYADRALLAAPSETVIQEANKIAKAYKLAVEGFEAWKEKNDLTTAHNKGAEAEVMIQSVEELSELKKPLQVLIKMLKEA